ncbi:hypothetical protein TIFTF001_023000 [Ficus carica]|uniref:Uncharacterized protein n=1 Tax=Ficus carica TaxID=3494 RepID=A0AA88AJM2_FICCA|nr:hypothetical protein TIFTF001_023000 [Ficus carica]
MRGGRRWQRLTVGSDGDYSCWGVNGSRWLGGGGVTAHRLKLQRGKFGARGLRCGDSRLGEESSGWGMEGLIWPFLEILTI